MAYRPLGHGSTSPVVPFGLIPSFDSSLVAAHGADLLAHPLGKANAGPQEVGVERVNSRSSHGCLAQRVTTTTLDRECVLGGGSSEPLDQKTTCTSVNSVVTLHGALTEEYPVPLSLAQREYANGMLALPSEGIVNAIADEPLNFQVLNSQACSNELAMGYPPSSHLRQETENVERDTLPISLPTATIVGQANAIPDNGAAYSSMNLSEYNLQGTCSLSDVNTPDIHLPSPTTWAHILPLATNQLLQAEPGESDDEIVVYQSHAERPANWNTYHHEDSRLRGPNSMAHLFGENDSQSSETVSATSMPDLDGTIMDNGYFQGLLPPMGAPLNKPPNFTNTEEWAKFVEAYIIPMLWDHLEVPQHSRVALEKVYNLNDATDFHVSGAEDVSENATKHMLHIFQQRISRIHPDCAPKILSITKDLRCADGTFNREKFTADDIAFCTAFKKTVSILAMLLGLQYLRDDPEAKQSFATDNYNLDESGIMTLAPKQPKAPKQTPAASSSQPPESTETRPVSNQLVARHTSHQAGKRPLTTSEQTDTQPKENPFLQLSATSVQLCEQLQNHVTSDRALTPNTIGEFNALLVQFATMHVPDYNVPVLELANHRNAIAAHRKQTFSTAVALLRVSDGNLLLKTRLLRLAKHLLVRCSNSLREMHQLINNEVPGPTLPAQPSHPGEVCFCRAIQQGLISRRAAEANSWTAYFAEDGITLRNDFKIDMEFHDGIPLSDTNPSASARNFLKKMIEVISFDKGRHTAFENRLSFLYIRMNRHADEAKQKITMRTLGYVFQVGCDRGQGFRIAQRLNANPLATGRIQLMQVTESPGRNIICTVQFDRKMGTQPADDDNFRLQPCFLDAFQVRDKLEILNGTTMDAVDSAKTATMMVTSLRRRYFLSTEATRPNHYALISKGLYVLEEHMTASPQKASPTPFPRTLVGRDVEFGSKRQDCFLRALYTAMKGTALHPGDTDTLHTSNPCIDRLNSTRSAKRITDDLITPLNKMLARDHPGVRFLQIDEPTTGDQVMACLRFLRLTGCFIDHVNRRVTLLTFTTPGELPSYVASEDPDEAFLKKYASNNRAVVVEIISYSNRTVAPGDKPTAHVEPMAKDVFPRNPNSWNTPEPHTSLFDMEELAAVIEVCCTRGTSNATKKPYSFIPNFGPAITADNKDALPSAMGADEEPPTFGSGTPRTATGKVSKESKSSAPRASATKEGPGREHTRSRDADPSTLDAVVEEGNVTIQSNTEDAGDEAITMAKLRKMVAEMSSQFGQAMNREINTLQTEVQKDMREIQKDMRGIQMDVRTFEGKVESAMDSLQRDMDKSLHAVNAKVDAIEHDKSPPTAPRTNVRPPQPPGSRPRYAGEDGSVSGTPAHGATAPRGTMLNTTRGMENGDDPPSMRVHIYSIFTAHEDNNRHQVIGSEFGRLGRASRTPSLQHVLSQFRILELDDDESGELSRIQDPREQHATVERALFNYGQIDPDLDFQHLAGHSTLIPFPEADWSTYYIQSKPTHILMVRIHSGMSMLNADLAGDDERRLANQANARVAHNTWMSTRDGMQQLLNLGTGSLTPMVSMIQRMMDYTSTNAELPIRNELNILLNRYPHATLDNSAAIREPNSRISRSDSSSDHDTPRRSKVRDMPIYQLMSIMQDYKWKGPKGMQIWHLTILVAWISGDAGESLQTFLAMCQPAEFLLVFTKLIIKYSEERFPRMRDMFSTASEELRAIARTEGRKIETAQASSQLAAISAGPDGSDNMEVANAFNSCLPEMLLTLRRVVSDVNTNEAQARDEIRWLLNIEKTPGMSDATFIHEVSQRLRNYHMLLGKDHFEKAVRAELRSFLSLVSRQLEADCHIRRLMIETANYVAKALEIDKLDECVKEINLRNNGTAYGDVAQSEKLVESEDDLQFLFQAACGVDKAGKLIMSILNGTARKLPKRARRGTSIGPDGNAETDDVMVISENTPLGLPILNMYHALGNHDIFTVNAPLPTSSHGRELATTVDMEALAVVQQPAPAQSDMRRLQESVMAVQQTVSDKADMHRLNNQINQTSADVRQLVNIMATRLGNATPEPLQHAAPPSVNAVMPVHDHSGTCSHNRDGLFAVGTANSTTCYQCGEAGHFARDCPNAAPSPVAKQNQPRRTPLRSRVSRNIGAARTQQSGAGRFRRADKPMNVYMEMSDDMKTHYSTTHKISNAKEFERRQREGCPDHGGPNSDHMLGHCLSGFFSSKRGQEYKGLESARQYVKKFLEDASKKLADYNLVDSVNVLDLLDSWDNSMCNTALGVDGLEHATCLVTEAVTEAILAADIRITDDSRRLATAPAMSVFEDAIYHLGNLDGSDPDADERA